MIIQRAHTAIHISAPAKVNLFLEVLGKRSDGFHEVRTLLCPIALFDQLHFELSPHSEAIELQVFLPAGADPTETAWDIPSDQRNLVHRAVTRTRQLLALRRQAAVGQSLVPPLGGCRIQLHKSIPATAGLGGGSSDAAAAVVASLLAWNSWDRQLAQDVCAEIGSDVAFFLGGPNGFGLALASGRGEQCQWLDCQPKFELCLTHPPVGCSTQRVYQGYVKPAEERDSKKIVAACESGQLKKIGAELFNALQLSASMQTDWIDRQLRLFAANGFPYALMSGSGSSCFGLFDPAESQQENERETPHQLHPDRVARLKHQAQLMGLSRVTTVQAWYGDSIEQQLSKQSSES